MHLAESVLNFVSIKEKMGEDAAQEFYRKFLRSGDIGSRRFQDCRYVLSNVSSETCECCSHPLRVVSMLVLFLVSFVLLFSDSCSYDMM